ncbi:MAG TPA: hypothetical protein VGF97_00890 [Rhizomicrobium sp.]|jgi:hypothetical protein
MRSLWDVVYNFHWIVRGEAARAAQAHIGFLGRLLKHHRIRAVINLRGSNPSYGWWRYETGVCEGLGVTHLDAKLNSRQLPTRRMLLDLLDAFDHLPRPFLMKCSGGQDRTSFAAAMFVIHTGGWGAMGQAEGQFAGWPYLHWPRGEQRWLQLFYPFAREQSCGRTLRDWTESSYSQQEFKNWLVARGEMHAFRGLYDSPEVTRVL